MVAATGEVAAVDWKRSQASRLAGREKQWLFRDQADSESAGLHAVFLARVKWLRVPGDEGRLKGQASGVDATVRDDSLTEHSDDVYPDTMRFSDCLSSVRSTDVA